MMMRISWQWGKKKTLDVTLVSTLAASAQSAGAAADLAASRKEAKYTSLTNSYIFQPIAMESTVRSVQVPSPSSPLWANAWLVPPAICARCQLELDFVSGWLRLWLVMLTYLYCYPLSLYHTRNVELFNVVGFFFLILWL